MLNIRPFVDMCHNHVGDSLDISRSPSTPSGRRRISRLPFLKSTMSWSLMIVMPIATDPSFFWMPAKFSAMDTTSYPRARESRGEGQWGPPANWPTIRRRCYMSLPPDDQRGIKGV